MRCSRCYTEVPNNVSYCPNCGQSMRFSGNNYNGNNNNKILIILIIVLALVLSIWGGVVAFMLMNSEVEDGDIPTNTPKVIDVQTPAPTPVQPTQEVPPTPLPTPQNGNTTVVILPGDSGGNTNSSNQGNSSGTAGNVVSGQTSGATVSYSTPSTSYSYPGKNLEDGFSCVYPSNFSVYDDGGDSQYTVKSSDGSARQIIDVEPIYGSTSQVMSNYIASHGGSASIQECGDNYFVARVNNGSTGYYKYGKKVGNKLYTAELIYPAEMSSEYGRVMNDIRGAFNK